MTWKVAHACVRGALHVRSGMPNQDAVEAVTRPGGMAVVAVSDGHGSARHFRSQVGSSLAVSTAVSVVEVFLTRFAGAEGAARLGAAEVAELERTLVESWTASVWNDLRNQPLKDDELARLEMEGLEARFSVERQPTLAYGATLLVTAATEHLVLYLQLGDGEILSVSAEGETTRPLPQDARLVGNQTTSLCQPEAWKEFRAAWSTATEMPAVVLLSTDGYANSFRSDEDFLKIGHDYLEILREQGIAKLAEELPAILQEATQQGSGDDITLAILQGDERGPVRPEVSEGVRSALIAQLMARHSSQVRRAVGPALRPEETRKSNARLRLLLAAAVLALAGAGAYLLCERIHWPHASDTPITRPKGLASGGKGGANAALETTPGFPS